MYQVWQHCAVVPLRWALSIYSSPPPPPRPSVAPSPPPPPPLTLSDVHRSPDLSIRSRGIGPGHVNARFARNSRGSRLFFLRLFSPFYPSLLTARVSCRARVRTCPNEVVPRASAGEPQRLCHSTKLAFRRAESCGHRRRPPL